MTQKKSSPGQFKKGYDPRRGRGPKPGAPNAGMPRDEIKRQVEAILTSPEVMSTLETILKNGAQVDAKLWVRLWSVVWDKIFPRPEQVVQLEGGVRHYMALPEKMPTTAEWLEKYVPQHARRLLPPGEPGE